MRGLRAWRLWRAGVLLEDEVASQAHPGNPRRIGLLACVAISSFPASHPRFTDSNDIVGRPIAERLIPRSAPIAITPHEVGGGATLTATRLIERHLV